MDLPKNDLSGDEFLENLAQKYRKDDAFLDQILKYREDSKEKGNMYAYEMLAFIIKDYMILGFSQNHNKSKQEP